MYPLLQSGQVQTDLREVREHSTKIGALIRSVEKLQARSLHGGTNQMAKNEDEARWANKGGQNVG